MIGETCPKCGAESGDDWSQCGGSCPMPMSPHYDPNAAKTKKVTWSLQLPGANYQASGEIEVPHDATDEDIQEAVDAEVFSIVSWGWEVEGGE